MTTVLIALVLLLAGGLVLLSLITRMKSRAPARPGARANADRQRPVESAASAALATRPAQAPSTAADTAKPEPPPELATFEWRPAAGLETAARQQLLERLRQLPRPSPALQQLVSPAFIEDASSSALGELVLGEPHIAAKVLATVNSPLYGLQRPVASIGQGITFLGLNTVRGICLRYLLDDSFKPSSPERKQVFERLWAASTLASELCQRLGQKLQLADAGTLVTPLLLSFLGHLAAASLLPPQTATVNGPHELLGRLRREQEALGLNAAEIGGLLLQEWSLPASIVAEVLAIDRMLLPPAGMPAGPQGLRRALVYLCARLGERLAFGGLDDLGNYALLQDESLDLLHLRSHLDAALLSALAAALRSPDVAGPVQRMTADLRKA